MGTPWVHEKDAQPGYQKHCKEDAIIEMGVAEIAAEVRKYGCRHVVLTGGEPLLQEEGLLELITELRKDGGDWFFEMETNGTRLPGESLMAALGPFNVSPKLANSGVSQTLREKPEVIRGL
ncbi:MAG: radical SAM protein, partial [Akkermansiaceae bacterium]